MHRGPAFAQLLDEKLQEISGPTHRATSSSHTRGCTPPHPLLFAAPYSFDCAAAGRFGCRVIHGERARLSQPPAKRTLTSQERFALEALNRFGAALTADFTLTELRSAYRTLARQYHPDRHRASDSGEQGQFARLFAEITHHHKTLRRAEQLQEAACISPGS